MRRWKSTPLIFGPGTGGRTHCFTLGKKENKSRVKLSSSSWLYIKSYLSLVAADTYFSLFTTKMHIAAINGIADRVATKIQNDISFWTSKTKGDFQVINGRQLTVESKIEKRLFDTYGLGPWRGYCWSSHSRSRGPVYSAPALCTPLQEWCCTGWNGFVYLTCTPTEQIINIVCSFNHTWVKCVCGFTKRVK